MKRKQFLMTGLALAAPALTGFRVSEAVTRSDGDTPQIQVRLGDDQRIERSIDGGQTWVKQPAFGPEVEVRELRQQDGLWQARLGRGDLEFWLHSENGRTWFTPGWRGRKSRLSRANSALS